MYSQSDLDSIQVLLKKRWLAAGAPAAVVLVSAIAVFIYGQLNRNDSLWMLTAALTILGGSYFLLFYGVYVRPASIYKKHVLYMLNGRKRETTGVFKAFSDLVVDRDGLEVRSMLLNVGEKDLPEDDRLFYYDIYKPVPDFPLGCRVTVTSNDKMVANMQLA